MLQDGDPRRQVRRLHPRDESGLESRHEPFVQVRNDFGGTIAREDDLLLRGVQFVERMEQFLVDLRHAAQELDVVEQEAVDAADAFPPSREAAVRSALGQAGCEGLAGQVEDLRPFLVRHNVVADRVEQVRLPEPRARRDQERVVGLGGLLRHRDGCGVREAVALSDGEAFEGEAGRKVCREFVRRRCLVDGLVDLLRRRQRSRRSVLLALFEDELQDLLRPFLEVALARSFEAILGLHALAVLQGLAKDLHLGIDVRMTDRIPEFLAEDGRPGFEAPHVQTREDSRCGLRLLHGVPHCEQRRRQDPGFPVEVRLDRGDVIGSFLPDSELFLDVRPVDRLRHPRSLEDFRGPFEDRVRIFPHEAVHVHAGMELEDARLVVRVLPHLLERIPSAILRIVPLMQARFRIAGAQEHDAFGAPPARAANGPDVARERVLLEIEEELLERLRPTPGRPDEFALWKKEVLGREVPSAGVHRAGPPKKVPT